VNVTIEQKVDTQARVIRSLNLIHSMDTQHMVGAAELERLLVENERLAAKIQQLYEGAEEQQQRIKRLENAGDKLCPAAAFMGLRNEVEVWRKAKEDKL
jgi:uncharacterized protein YigA (DUF484 family)